MNTTDQVSVREYVERILDEREKTIAQVAGALEVRLGHLNALRDQVMADRSQFLPKDVYNEMHDALAQRVNRIETTQARMIGVASVIVIVAGILGAVIGHITK